MHHEIEEAVKAMENGGLILYPTDTIWGIGCDATNKEAVDKIFHLKQRAESKSLIVLVDGDQKLMRHVPEIPEVAWDILEYAERPTTIIYDNPRGLAPNAVAADNSVGIRIVQDEFCQKLIQRFKKPIISTSANISGQPSPAGFKDIDPTILEGVDYVVNLRQNETAVPKPSVIIKLTSDSRVTVIRK